MRPRKEIKVQEKVEYNLCFLNLRKMYKSKGELDT